MNASYLRCYVRALLLPLIGVGAALVACGGRQTSKPPAQEAPACQVFDSVAPSIDDIPVEATETSLPSVEEGGERWQRLMRFFQCLDPTPTRCASALEGGERWWEQVRDEAQQLFIADEAPDAETVAAWTDARRVFFERWLATPTPVLRLQGDVFVLSDAVFSVFEAWARCAEDEDAAARWKARSETLN